MKTMEFPSTPDVRAAIALACRLYGRKAGWHLAAQRLGIAARTARGIEYGEASGAAVCPRRALEARVHFTRLRSAQLRAELAQLESTTHDATHLAQPLPRVPVGG